MYSDTAASLLAREHWFESELGRHVLGEERVMMDAKLPGLYGFHLMQMGISRRVSLFENSMIRHKFSMAQLPGGQGISALAEPEQLPIESDSVDVVLLHHVLEYSPNPHQLLREAARVIVPHGHLLVIGFNPWSAFGLRCLLGRRFAQPIWQSRLLGTRRLADWLGLLDFAVDDVQYRFYGLPVDHAATLARLSRVDRLGADWRLPCGSVYLVHARKQISPLTMVRPSRRLAAPRMSQLPLATPRTRGSTLH
jgi:SAM-dependent methyltransferase